MLKIESFCNSVQQIPRKEVGHSEVYPQVILYSPNGKRYAHLVTNV